MWSVLQDAPHSAAEWWPHSRSGECGLHAEPHGSGLEAEDCDDYERRRDHRTALVVAQRTGECREVGQDAAHDPGREREEVAAVGKRNFILLDHSQIRFVNQRRGLQRVVGARAAHVSRGDSMELAIDKRCQVLDGEVLVVVPRLEDLGDVAGHVVPSLLGLYSAWRRPGP